MKSDTLTLKPGAPLRGTATVPGDKSISHRALLLGMLGQGATQVRGWLAAGDTEATLGAVRALGVPVERHDTYTLTVHGGSLQAPVAPLDFVNAGTGIRLAAGIMAGQPFASVLDGSAQLRRRPMKRIIAPLREMGAAITGVDHRAPLTVQPARLTGQTHHLKTASAQVKSAILLAGLFAQGETVVIEPGPARDHTERMLLAMGADITVEGRHVTLKPGASLRPMDLTVPGDFSSAAFLIVAALVVPDSDLTLTGINLNATRTGLLDVLLEMGAAIDVTETGLEAGEPVGSIRVRYGPLRGVAVGGEVNLVRQDRVHPSGWIGDRLGPGQDQFAAPVVPRHVVRPGRRADQAIPLAMQDQSHRLAASLSLSQGRRLCRAVCLRHAIEPIHAQPRHRAIAIGCEVNPLRHQHHAIPRLDQPPKPIRHQVNPQ